VGEQARQLDDVVRQLGARYYQDLGRPQPPAGPAGEPAPDATEEDVELAFDMPAEAPAAIAPRPTGAPADPGAMVDAESRSRRDRARQRSSRRPQPAARGDEEGAEAEELEREANGYFYQDSNTDIRGRTEALWNTRSLTVGGGGGGTFGGRFGGRRAAETTGTPGTAAIGLRSLAVELPRNEITASFRTSGAAGQLVITYITQERSRTYAALGATGAALIILASLWWILASLQVRVTVRGAVGLTVTVVGIVLALAGLPLWGTPVAAVGAVLTPWKGKLASRAASATPSTARED
jgi:hypothetical protein